MAFNKFYIIIAVLIGIVCRCTYSQQHFRNDYKYIAATDSHYKIHTLHKNWQEAKKVCIQEGASLYYPENEYEVNATLDYWKAEQPGFWWVWVGISDLQAKGVFETIDGRSVYEVYSKWGPGEPNDTDGNEDCVILRNEGTLNDDKCDKKYPFMCKRTAASIDWNKDCDTYDESYVLNKQLGKCYKFHLTPMNWTDAYAVCSSEQSYLAIINSKAETEHLVEITKNAPKDNIKGNYLAGAVYLGFHNRFGEGWQTTKNTKLEDTGYVDWGNQQPDGGEKEQCGSMFYNGRLNDLACDRRCFFICEHDVSSLHFSVVERILRK